MIQVLWSHTLSLPSPSAKKRVCVAANDLDHLRIRLVKPQLSLEVHSLTCIHNSLIHSFILFFFSVRCCSQRPIIKRWVYFICVISQVEFFATCHKYLTVIHVFLVWFIVYSIKSMGYFFKINYAESILILL